MLANIVYLIIFCLINCYLNYLLLDYFIKKPLFNRPEPQAEISLDDIKRLLNDTRHGFKKIEQTFYKGEHMITHETSLENFTEQFDFVINNYTSHEMNVNQFDNIIMGGLGGSGIGAVLAKNWFFDKCPVPIETVADYHLPKFASSKTLVILNSYSGNTEETLQLFREANQLGCSIIVLTGGGKLKELATQNNLKTYDLKGGYQPRMTVGQGLGFISMIFGELLGEDHRPIIQGIRDYFEENRDRQKQSGEQIFNFRLCGVAGPSPPPQTSLLTWGLPPPDPRARIALSMSSYDMSCDHETYLVIANRQ